MKKDPLVHIDDIYDSIKAIQKYTFGLSRADFMASSEKQDAVIRRLEVIGEAANRLTDDFRGHYPEIPWSGIVGLRSDSFLSILLPLMLGRCAHRRPCSAPESRTRG
jgi:uncharacterized protein with HEPN domain